MAANHLKKQLETYGRSVCHKAFFGIFGELWRVTITFFQID